MLEEMRAYVYREEEQRTHNVESQMCTIAQPSMKRHERWRVQTVRRPRWPVVTVRLEFHADDGHDRSKCDHNE
jgi:hypothetical protein